MRGLFDAQVLDEADRGHAQHASYGPLQRPLSDPQGAGGLRDADRLVQAQAPPALERGHRRVGVGQGAGDGGRPMHRGGRHLPGSPLAGPYRPGPDGTREEVLDKYREHLLGRPDLLALPPALRGRRLGCWCVPEPCHAQVVAELADAS